MDGHEVVIRSKVSVPPLPSPLAPRPRLGRLISTLLDRHRLVTVTATAGAGKTTAVAGVMRELGSPVAWLTLDDSDTVPGRLAVYLEAALARALPECAGTVSRALATGISHAEAAGLLAEAASARDVVVVIDELERLSGAPDALAVIDALIRYSTLPVRMVLAGRHEVPLHGAKGVVGCVTERDLAFTTEEAAQALSTLGKGNIDAAEVVCATGGWVTGVLFEAWSASDHVAGTGGESDPLHGYLATQILESLTPEDRDFLVTTSLLDTVTVARAEGLGQRDVAGRMAALRRLHLPVTWEESGDAMRCHPRFREYLAQCLRRSGDAALRDLRATHGRLLASEGRHEEAVEELLRAGCNAEACGSAEAVIETLIERLDFAVAERWLEALADESPSVGGALTAAELMVAVGREQYRRGARIADQLAALGERHALAARSSRAAATMAWCYHHVGRLDDAHAVLGAAPPGRETDTARYLLALASHSSVPTTAPPLSGGPLDGLIIRVDSIRGHFADSDRALSSRWAAAVMSPWRISALRATGYTERAQGLVEQAEASGVSTVSLRALVAVEILLDLRRRDEALEALHRGRELIARSGSRVFAMQSSALEAKLFLRLDRDPTTALGILNELERDTPIADYAYVQEVVDTWYGLAHLQRGEDARARERLARAVDSMLGADRILELPTAAVYLAEAAWRVGDEGAADAAADIAVDAARRQGSRHILLQAMRDYPAVVSRRIDAEREPDSAWHGLGRAVGLRQAGAMRGSGADVELREFGEPAVRLGELEVTPRLSKSVELLAFLAHNGGAATRDELLDALFEGRADESARAYLRQAVHALRQVLPKDVAPSLHKGGVRLQNGIVLIGESGSFEAMLADASRREGESRLDSLLAALALPARGAYLDGRASTWINERRETLESLAADGRLDAAELALGAGRYDVADELVQAILAADPFREAASRLEMRIASALGDGDRVIRSYRRCQRALAQIGTEPGRSTRQLLGQLRS